MCVGYDLFIAHKKKSDIRTPSPTFLLVPSLAGEQGTAVQLREGGCSGLQWRTAAAWKAAGVRERGLVGVRSEGEAEGEGQSQGESGSEVRVRSGSESKRR